MGDDAALADRIRQLLGSVELRRTMGDEARRTVRERVNVSRMIRAFERAIDDEPDTDATTH
jgi:glycosyltransferase involved in cell wall biosynthesis